MDDSQEKVFVYLWQKRLLNLEKQKLPNKIDSIRYCLPQLDYLNQNNRAFKEYWSLESKELEIRKTYSNLVDQKSNANNYAEAILSINKGFKNDSKNWKSSLEVDDLIQSMGATKNDSEYEEECKKLAAVFQASEKSDFKSCLKVENCLKNDFEKTEEILPNFDIFNSHDLLNEVTSSPPTHLNSNEFQTLEGSFIDHITNMGTKNKPRILGREANRLSHSSSFPTSPNQISRNFSKTEPREISFKERRYPWESRKTEETPKHPSFRTASHQLDIENQKKFGAGRGSAKDMYGNPKRSLGARGIKSKFVPPVRKEEESPYGGNGCEGIGSENNPFAELLTDERLKNIDAKMVELIMNEIMDRGSPVTWDDIAGLDLAKSTIQEIVVWPMLRPDLFTGLRGPPKGLLLFGPPGTGKTMIGKCIASQSESTFFSISASSLTSKWVGEGEKMVRAMFAVAKCHQPAVIFIDEIDSLLTQRSDSEHESSRRLKTEFLVQLDGATSSEDERILVVGATNRPQELDEAARRRLVKRLYIPLPEIKAREKIVKNLLQNQSHSLSDEDINEVGQKTEGYSGADMANLCREAALGPIRSLKFTDIQSIAVDQVRPISLDDFVSALHAIRASVSSQDLHLYQEWNGKYGINSRS